jgi:hypothetical protein
MSSSRAAFSNAFGMQVASISHWMGATAMSDTTLFWLLVAVAVVAVVVLAIAAGRGRSRTRHVEIKRHFGPEYDRAVEDLGSSERADRLLAERAERVQRFRIRELSRSDRDRFSSEWMRIQAGFVDDPGVAVGEANALIEQVMRARGCPSQGFEERLEHLSVNHPTVVQHYRAANELSDSSRSGHLNTEELRQAVVHYRVIFADLLEEPGAGTVRGFRDAHAH